MQQAVQRAVADKEHTIRMPVHMGEKIRKMARAYNELFAEFERDSSDGEVAGRLERAVGEAHGSKDAMPDATSINRPLSSERGASEVREFVEDERASRTAGEVMREMETRGLVEAMKGSPHESGRIVR